MKTITVPAPIDMTAQGFGSVTFRQVLTFLFERDARWDTQAARMAAMRIDTAMRLNAGANATIVVEDADHVVLLANTASLPGELLGRTANDDIQTRAFQALVLGGKLPPFRTAIVNAV